MMNDKTLNANGQQLHTQLASIYVADKNRVDDKGQMINVAGVGSVVSSAYEQLRNAAEYAQEHLLIQNAIRRFYSRSLPFHGQAAIDKSLAEELVIELTQSGYLQNNTIQTEKVSKLYKAIQKHYGNYWRLRTAGISDSKSRGWTLDLLSLESEDLLIANEAQSVYVQFAYSHYREVLPKKVFAGSSSEDAVFEVSLYIAVHRSLLKSDVAAVRYDMQKLYKVDDTDIATYAKFHESVDEAFSSPITNKIVVYINKYGAPLRVLRSMMRDKDNIAELVMNREQFEVAYADQVRREYARAEAKLNRGLFKSIVFLLITKTLIGVAIEVPYDLAVIGEVMWVPLLVNLFTPPLYMALLRFGFKLPGAVNAKALSAYADEMLYGEPKKNNLYPAPKEKRYPIGFTVAYALLFLVVFGLVSYVLILLQFNAIQGLLFFTFLAAASFLGFRLSRIVHELELVAPKSGGFTTLRDLLFTPFTFLGKWLSDKYQKVNIVALILDTLIEMPLKTVLRLLRQWTRFIDEKKDTF